MPIPFFFLACIVSVGSKIIIEDANIAAVSRDDIGMIFYVALHNTDNCGYRIYTRMVKCIEEVENNDRECEMMQLIGGDMGEIRPQCFKNITLLYPNMYLHNRRGYCIIAIKFISEDNQVLEKKTNISFNTYLNNKNNRGRAMTSYYDKTNFVQCDSVDLDPLDKCEPVDCHMKYLGTRSFYNRKWKRCQKVPVCVFDVEKDLPDVGYTPITNKCIDLERCIKKSDLQPLDGKSGETGEDSTFATMLTAIHCHFGKINNETGLCDCKPGWTSAPFDKEPTLFPVHMCNIELSSWYDSNRSEITFIAFIIAIVAVGVAMLVVLISFILYHIYRCLRKMEGKKVKCYCDLETGDMTDNDKDRKKQKKDRKKSVKKSESGDTKASGSKSRKTKSKDSVRTEGTVDNQQAPSEAESQPTGSKTQQQSIGEASRTSIKSDGKKEQKAKGKDKEKKKKGKAEEVQPVSTDASSPSKQSSKDEIAEPVKPSSTTMTSGKKSRK